ncbi:hypothetical protein YK56LOC_62400 [Caballeronia sp. HLA56]
MHIERHRQMLKQATPETLRVIEEKMKQERPGAFHVETGENQTLSDRTFMDEPRQSIPMAGFRNGYQPPAKKEAATASDKNAKENAEKSKRTVTEG